MSGLRVGGCWGERSLGVLFGMASPALAHADREGEQPV